MRSKGAGEPAVRIARPCGPLALLRQSCAGQRQVALGGTINCDMSISLYVCDCPECHSEISVDLGAAHRPFSDNEKMVYRVVCGTCGLSYDVHFEDLRLGDE